MTLKKKEKWEKEVLNKKQTEICSKSIIVHSQTKCEIEK